MIFLSQAMRRLPLILMLNICLSAAAVLVDLPALAHQAVAVAVKLYQVVFQLDPAHQSRYPLVPGVPLQVPLM